MWKCCLVLGQTFLINISAKRLNVMQFQKYSTDFFDSLNCSIHRARVLRCWTEEYCETKKPHLVKRCFTKSQDFLTQHNWIGFHKELVVSTYFTKTMFDYSQQCFTKIQQCLHSTNVYVFIKGSLCTDISHFHAKAPQLSNAMVSWNLFKSLTGETLSTSF